MAYSSDHILFPRLGSAWPSVYGAANTAGLCRVLNTGKGSGTSGTLTQPAAAATSESPTSPASCRVALAEDPKEAAGRTACYHIIFIIFVQ